MVTFRGLFSCLAFPFRFSSISTTGAFAPASMPFVRLFQEAGVILSLSRAAIRSAKPWSVWNSILRPFPLRLTRANSLPSAPLISSLSGFGDGCFRDNLSKRIREALIRTCRAELSEPISSSALIAAAPLAKH